MDTKLVVLILLNLFIVTFSSCFL